MHLRLLATKAVCVSTLIHVTPETYQDDTFELRHEIAEYAREGAIAPDALKPQCVTLCFLADHVTWTQRTLVRQPVDPLFAAFRRWGMGTPIAAEFTRQSFDHYLRKFLHATSLSYTINPETSAVVHAQGLRFNTQPRNEQQRQVVIEALSRLDHPAF